MKKTLVFGAAIALLATTANADVKLTNTFGADEDNIWGGDFMSWERKTDDEATPDRDEAEEFKSSDVLVSDRLQADISSEKFDSRIRLEFKNKNLNGKEAQVRLRGYGRFTPIEQIQLAAGNEFFTKYGVSAAYLAAADDTLSSGRMAESGFAFNTNFAGVKIVANLAGDSKADDAENLGLNFGFDAVIPDAVKFGATFKNVTSENPTIGAFAGLGSVENLVLNAGYVYNNPDLNNWKNSMQFTCGYSFSDIGLTLAADVMTGLSNEYIKDGKTVEAKNGDDKLYPLSTRFAAGYGVTENLTLNADVQVSCVINQDNSTKTVLYPSVEYSLPKKMGSLIAGVRLAFNNAEDNGGLQKISIPLCWKWTALNVKSAN